MRLVLPPRTRGKITILGHSYRKCLLDEIGEDNVPACYGGRLNWAWPGLTPVERWTEISDAVPTVGVEEGLRQAHCPHGNTGGVTEADLSRLVPRGGSCREA